MKLTFLLTLISALQVCANGYSQQKVTLSLSQTSLDKVLETLEMKSGYKFLLNHKTVAADKKIDVHVRDATVPEVLDRILDSTLTYRLLENDLIVIIPAEKERQDITVKGTVTDTLGNPLPGVTLKIKDTNRGVVTNAMGQYELAVPEDAVLVVSFVGYQQQEVQVGRRTRIDIVLRTAASQLSDVVVIGYGTQKKVNLTGAVSTVSAEELLKRPVTNPVLMLQGKVPGLQIVQNSGQPGMDNNTIQIRGQGTFSGAGNNPLVLIDGVEGSLSMLNPNMIESISVLKDAASGAIYGARAANGVILVTTRQGTAGQFNVDYQYNIGLQRATRLPKLINNSVEYMELLNEAIDRTGQQKDKRYKEADIEAYRQGQATDPERYPSYDWIKTMFSPAIMQQHYLSMNGGQNKTTYNFGMGYLDQEGVMMATRYKKYDAMLNVSTRMNKVITFGANINFSHGNMQEPVSGTQDMLILTYTAHPTYGPYLPDGSGRYTSRAYPYESANQNPVAKSNLGGHTLRNYNINGIGFVKLNLAEGLVAELRGAGNWRFTDELAQGASIPVYYFQPDANGVHGAAQNFGGNDHTLTRKNNNSNRYTYFATLTYDKVFNKKHHLTLLGGYNQEYFRSSDLQGYRYQFINLDMKDLDAGNANGQTTGGKSFEWAIQSVFGRANYAFNDKYLFEASLRYDGSSRFAKGNRWGLFPSVSAGWRLSQENFLKNTRWLDNLKIRGSWGQLGNENIGNYPWQDLLDLAYYSFGSYTQGVARNKLSNTGITWETTTSYNLGLDFSFLNGKLSGTIDWFGKTTTDILREQQVPSFVGMAGPTVNKGAMKNTGLEILLGHENRIGDFAYGVNVNFTTYRNEVTRFGAREISGERIRQEGLPWNSYYLLEQVGIFRSWDEINDPSTPKHPGNPQPGDLRFRDVSGPEGVPDGKIDATYDRVVIPGAFPDFNYGINANASWKNFDLSIFLQGVQGREVYVREWGIAPFRQYGPPPVMWRDRWTPQNPNAKLPGLWVENSYTPNTQASSFWLQNASYLRLKNVQLGYNFSMNWMKRVGLKRARVWFSGDNLVTWTRYYDGGDPERVEEGRFAIYPQTAIYSLGIKLTF